MFALRFDQDIVQVSKIRDVDFTPVHHDVLTQMQYQAGRLILPDPRWHSQYLGEGEEKAVFCVCDENQRVFAVELIDERHYLNGRFVTGTYFFDKRIPALNHVKAHADSEFGLMFTGLVKVREFAHGYEWGRFQFDPRRKTALDIPLTAFLQSVFMSQFRHYQSHYRDVHDRNVLFEIRDFHQPGVPLLIKTWTSQLAAVKIGLQPIDVR